MTDATQPPLLFMVVEVACWLVGVMLCVRFLQGHLGPPRASLATWSIKLEDFALSAILVALGGFILPQALPFLMQVIFGSVDKAGDRWMVVQGAVFQLGLLGGAFLGGLLCNRPGHAGVTVEPSGPPFFRHSLLGGLATFLIALPLIGGIGFAWKYILDFFGYATNEQEMVDLFRNAEDRVVLISMIALAAVVAPVTEELIFRAGLFRYLRTRIPRWIAFALPALIFALLHANLAAFVPLLVLGLFFSLAYERTGRIAVPMIAHALFNLHTILLIMTGVTA